MSLDDAKEYFSKYLNADDRLAMWKEKTGYTETTKPAKKEAPAEEAEE